jgi:hypothetical protein
LISFPFTAGCISWVINGRSSDLSWLLKPSHSYPGRDVQNSGILQKPYTPEGFGVTAAGTVTDSNGIPFSFHPPAADYRKPMM